MDKFLVLFITFSSSAALAAEKAGMPQLNPDSWIPQIFWLALTFSVLYLVIAKIALPRLSESIEQRDDHISDHIDEAKNLKNQAEKKYQEYLSLIENAKKEAKDLINKNKKKLQEEFENKKKELNTKLEVKLEEVDKEIQSFKKEAIQNIGSISSEVARELVQKISKIEANKASVNAIVEEVSKNYLKELN